MFKITRNHVSKTSKLVALGLVTELSLFGCAGLPDSAPMEFSQASTVLERADDEEVEDFFPNTMDRAEETLDLAKSEYMEAEKYVDPEARREKQAQAVKQANEAKSLAEGARAAKMKVKAWDSNIEMFEKSQYSKTMGQLGEDIKANLAGVKGELESEISELRSTVNENEEAVQMTKTVAYFKTGSTTLNSKSLDEISGVADVLKKNPNLRAQVIGYTDTRGSEEVNEKLAKTRSMAVASELKAHGVDESRISIRPVGELEDASSPQSGKMARMQLSRKVDVRVYSAQSR